MWTTKLNDKVIGRRIKHDEAKHGEHEKTNDNLKAEIEVLKKTMPQLQHQDNKDKREKGGWWVEDSWKEWNKRDETTKGGGGTKG